MGGPRPRERILVAATRLFAGKDELVAATLERWSREWLGWLRQEAGEDGDDAGTRLERLWDALEKWFADEGFRGSYVANVATELRAWPGHPAQPAVAAHRA